MMHPDSGPPRKLALGLNLPVVEPPRAAAIDPVCGMTVDPATAAGSATFEDKTYYFCNPRCREKFEADPHKYLGRAETTVPAAAPELGVKYTCPMHPEVLRDHPGSCPKC